MPYKYNESRRHKIDKPIYKVTNWKDYNNSLRKRGNFTIWLTGEAIAGWHPAKTGARGRPKKYSEHAIQTALLLRQVYRLPLRQTQGLMTSLAVVLKVDIGIPDFSNVSKRGKILPRSVLTKAVQPGSHVIVDSTGLKVYGKDEWHREKHGVSARRTWRKLHLAVDENHNIIACELTTPDVGDPTAVPDLLGQLDSSFESFIADGAYDGDPVAQAVLAKQPDANVIVPPHITAVFSEKGYTQRDQHIRDIDQCGWMAWQNKTGYGLRNYAELAMQRYKRIFGNTLKARALPQQKTEAWIGALALNQMTALGMSVSVKI